jgi:4a-hydroxytetrahydrobiopterin dehydratase
MDRVAQEEVTAALAGLPGWESRDDTITKTFKFRDFAHAIEFVNALAVMAEDARHHPDIEIRYNKVTLNLTSHEAGGLTQADLDLAVGIEGLGTESV